MLAVVALAVTAGAQGFRTLEAYEGAKFPTGAGVWTSLFDPYGPDSPTDGFNWGPVLDVDGDGKEDVSDLGRVPGCCLLRTGRTGPASEASRNAGT